MLAKKFAIRFGVGASLYELNEVNDRFYGSFGNDLHISFGAAFFIIPNLSIDVNLLYLTEGITIEETPIPCDFGGPCPELSSSGRRQTELLLPSLSIRYHVFSNKFGYFWGIGSALGLGGFQIEHWLINREEAPVIVSNRKGEFAAHGLGYILNTGFTYQISRVISSVFEVGYRRMKTGELKGGEQYFNVDEANLDFSGPFISTGFEIRF
ncbi:hypothetical protein GWO43_06595 [candidate division KSB1 bacterium]|nr:hypothetical protein [candidate division KSB1 bacterium]NIR72536.1 hypothetical protein [candidate division KSB1 bacterium]NIS23631.1 hypothetical protein [candidate division KSB1 bacterium]NIT70555.1 hypothetical protein [candidate division KSB1 bacterium]NIU24273.1 hypothetical protein [candidate division KSB1 bacterium]